MISATAMRRAVFAKMPAGLAAVANSDIAAEDTCMWLPEPGVCDERRIGAMEPWKRRAHAAPR
jgi:hypothetical protein